MLVDTSLFSKTYGRALETLDGTDDASYVDFFFMPSPLQPGAWHFVDEDARLDFYDLACEMGITLSVSEIQVCRQ